MSANAFHDVNLFTRLKKQLQSSLLSVSVFLLTEKGRKYKGTLKWFWKLFLLCREFTMGWNLHPVSSYFVMNINEGLVFPPAPFSMAPQHAPFSHCHALFFQHHAFFPVPCPFPAPCLLFYQTLRANYQINPHLYSWHQLFWQQVNTLTLIPPNH